MARSYGKALLLCGTIALASLPITGAHASSIFQHDDIAKLQDQGGAIGVSFSTITYNDNGINIFGAKISSVKKNSSFYADVILDGDIIIGIQGLSFNDEESFRKFIRSYPPQSFISISRECYLKIDWAFCKNESRLSGLS